jgi:hypothetical protein
MFNTVITSRFHQATREYAAGCRTYLGRTLKPISALALLTIATVTALPPPAAAQSIRFVSATGGDGNDCTRTRPCRSLQRAVNVSADGGEVQILDSGHFGNTVSITKSITISAEGVAASLRSININNASAKVVLRGLLLNGQGAPAETSGLRASAAASIHVIRCEFEHHHHGISISMAASEVYITDTISRNNRLDGLRVIGTAQSRLVVDNSRFENNGDDGAQIDWVRTTVNRSVFGGNGGHGIEGNFSKINVNSTVAANNVDSGYYTGWDGQMWIESSMASGNGRGIFVGEGDILNLSNSTLSNNGIAIFNRGTILSRQNNMVTGNTTTLNGNAPIALAGM